MGDGAIRAARHERLRTVHPIRYWHENQASRGALPIKAERKSSSSASSTDISIASKPAFVNSFELSARLCPASPGGRLQCLGQLPACQGPSPKRRCGQSQQAYTERIMRGGDAWQQSGQGERQSGVGMEPRT